MFKIFEKWQKAKKERWEMANLSNEQKNKYFSPQDLEKQKQYQLNNLIDRLRKLEIKYETLGNLITSKKNIVPKWRVIQDKNSETEWIREGQPTYVGKIYNEGKRWCFTAIIDGQNIPFSCESYEAAEQQKLSLLDIERIEKYDPTETKVDE